MKPFQRMLAMLLMFTIFCSLMPAALAASYTGTVNTDDVFFRMKANTNCGFHCRLDKNDKVTVTGISGDFYKVSYKGKTGYVMQKFVTLSDSAEKALGVAASNSSYASATKISQLGDAPKATQKGSTGKNVEKLQQALKIKGYYTGVVDGKYGNNTANAVKAFQKSVGLSQSGKADNNTILKLFGSVSSTTVANDPNMNGIKSISQITVPKTTKKGDSGKDVLALQQALKIKGYYTAPITSKYDDKTVTAVKAFQKAKKITQDGVANNDTIKALFGKNAANFTYKTERLDWFNGGSNVIPRGAVITVKDVSTGKTFRVKRWAGANHLDGEPLTAKDTATMKEIYGGSWSWTRRAILVMYNGHVYAASMNGMPHGTTTISNNNFKGHFCIHFYNSRTHETNKVDSAHQSAVRRAMNATW